MLTHLASPVSAASAESAHAVRCGGQVIVPTPQFAALYEELAGFANAQGEIAPPLDADRGADLDRDVETAAASLRLVCARLGWQPRFDAEYDTLVRLDRPAPPDDPAVLTAFAGVLHRVAAFGHLAYQYPRGESGIYLLGGSEDLPVHLPGQVVHGTVLDAAEQVSPRTTAHGDHTRQALGGVSHDVGHATSGASGDDALGR